MLNPIKRIWVPKKVATDADATVNVPAYTPAVHLQDMPTPKQPSARSVLFDDLPEPDVEEKNSDSIWAVFDTIHTPDIDEK